MEEIISQFMNLCEEDVENMTNEEKLLFYKSSLKDLDNLLNTKDIAIEDYQVLLQTKRNLLAKVFMLED